jgi:hypothetical protein
MVFTKEFDLLAEDAMYFLLSPRRYDMTFHLSPEFLPLRIKIIVGKVLQHPRPHIGMPKFILDNAVHHHFDCVIQQDHSEP